MGKSRDEKIAEALRKQAKTNPYSSSVDVSRMKHRTGYVKSEPLPFKKELPYTAEDNVIYVIFRPRLYLKNGVLSDKP